MREILKQIILCCDNSDLSFKGSEAAINLAQAFGSEVVGIHGQDS